MPSHVWGRDPQEAFEEPYEYAVQEQFVREASPLLLEFYGLLNSERLNFSLSDTSAQKAVWLLAMDSLDSLRDCLTALTRKEHRVAGKLFRNVAESIDLAAYFHSGDSRSRKDLEKWYRNEVVPHREYRDYVRRVHGEQQAEALAKHYASLSRFTHRSYRSILEGYIRGRDDRLVHDGFSELNGHGEDSKTFLVLPQVIAAYYATLANLIMVFADALPELGLITREQVRDAFDRSLETETVPRRFYPRRWLARKFKEDSGQA